MATQLPIPGSFEWQQSIKRVESVLGRPLTTTEYRTLYAQACDSHSEAKESKGIHTPFYRDSWARKGKRQQQSKR